MKLHVYIIILIISLTHIKLFSQVQEFYITCDKADFHYIYENYAEDNYVPCTITYNSRAWENCRMRIRGDDTRTLPKKSLKVKFDGDRFINGRKTLNFNAEYEDRSYIHSVLASKLMRESGQPCFEATHARLYLNGEFLGLYIMIENMDTDFLEGWNFNPLGNLYKATNPGACLNIYELWGGIDNNWEKKTNEGSGGKDLEKFIYDLNMTPDKTFKSFANDNIVYDKMINIIAMNMLLANGSTYYHNYFMFHDIIGSGKWIMFPWDMDKTFSYNGPHFQYDISTQFYHPDNSFMERVLIDKEMFSDLQKRLEELAATIFNPDHLYPVVDSLVNVIHSSVEQDTTDNIQDTTLWMDFIEADKYYISKRYEILKEQISTLPYSFRIHHTWNTFINDVKFSWNRTKDADGGEIKYRLKWGPDYLLRDDRDTRIVENITDTSYIVPEKIAPGKYFWTVEATDGTNYVYGYDNYNYFYFAHPTKLNCYIDGEVTLTKDNSPYYADCHIRVSKNGILRIEEGVELILASGININVEGKLEINGTTEEPVKISPDGDADVLSHLVIDKAVQNCLIKNAELNNVELAGTESDITVDSSKFTVTLPLEEILIRDHDGKMTIKNSIINGAGQGEGIIFFNSDGHIENSKIYNIPDAIEYIEVIDGTIINNEIYDSGDDGIDMNGCENIFIYGNKIFRSHDKGITCGDEAGKGSKNIMIERNLIVGCWGGIGVKNSSVVKITNNTLYGNNYGLYIYEKTEGYGGGSAEVTNTIIANSDMTLYVDDKSDVNISYSLSDKEMLPGLENIYSDPEFVSLPMNDFHLKENSPCIDKGNPNSPKDPDDTRNDIGAYYYNQGLYNIVINEINYNSADDFNPEDWVEFYNPNPFDVDISNWRFLDEKDIHIFKFPENTILKTGSYLVLCKDEDSLKKYFPGVKNFIGNMGFGLSGSGEMIRLFNNSNKLIDYVDYDDKLPWPTEPDGKGPTLELIDAILDNALPESWKKSKGYGTPGKINSVATDIEYRDFGKNQYSVRAWPNPFSDEINMIIPDLNSGETRVRIFDISGITIKEENFKNNVSNNIKLSFDTSDMSRGIYFIEISSGTYFKIISLIKL